MTSMTFIHGGEASPDAVAAFFQDIVVGYQSYQKLVRRGEPREAAAIPVEVQPMDAELRPIGSPFHAVTRDISSTGVGLFHHERIDSEFLRLEFSSPLTGQTLAIVVHVQHCTPCGRYFIAGCQFRADVECERQGIDGEYVDQAG